MANPRHLEMIKRGPRVWNFFRLKNINESVDLSGADLSNAKLSGANLSKADLRLATFSSTQAEGTNFTEADFTGVRLESWSIDKKTNLDSVLCEFYREHDKRHPEQGNFLPGDFTGLFQEKYKSSAPQQSLAKEKIEKGLAKEEIEKEIEKILYDLLAQGVTPEDAKKKLAELVAEHAIENPVLQDLFIFLVKAAASKVVNAAAGEVVREAVKDLVPMIVQTGLEMIGITAH